MADRAWLTALAAQYREQGDAVGWFEAAYQQHAAGANALPWADRLPNPNLLSYWEAHPLDGTGMRALVAGCGFGDDAQQISSWGFETVAFDIAPTAISACRERFPGSAVEYVVADLFAPPQEWTGQFDFVFEAYTVQALPIELRAAAIAQLAGFVRSGGSILIIARGRDDSDLAIEMPWPLSHSEIAGFVRAGLELVSFEDYWDMEEPPVRRFRALYRRA